MPNAKLPYSARPLTGKELSREDVYLLHSPKHDTTTTLVGVARLAFWLEQEFDSTVLACIPRPRRLTLHSAKEIEVDFWTQTMDHEETFWVVLYDEDIVYTKDGPAPKDQALWDHAASLSGLNLRFVFEADLHKRAQVIANYMRLLPHVQACMRLKERDHLFGRVREVFGPGIVSLSFNQIVSSLSDYPPAHVLMAACTLIHRGWLNFERTIDVSLATPLQRGPGA